MNSSFIYFVFYFLLGLPKVFLFGNNYRFIGSFRNNTLQYCLVCVPQVEFPLMLNCTQLQYNIKFYSGTICTCYQISRVYMYFYVSVQFFKVLSPVDFSYYHHNQRTELPTPQNPLFYPFVVTPITLFPSMLPTPYLWQALIYNLKIMIYIL